MYRLVDDLLFACALLRPDFVLEPEDALLCSGLLCPKLSESACGLIGYAVPGLRAADSLKADLRTLHTLSGARELRLHPLEACLRTLHTLSGARELRMHPLEACLRTLHARLLSGDRLPNTLQAEAATL